jgi:hypothetical protein
MTLEIKQGYDYRSALYIASSSAESEGPKGNQFSLNAKVVKKG